MSDELLKENMVTREIQPEDWQHPNKRCAICGQDECDCQAKLVSIQRSFMTVACCWNCRHRVGGHGPRGSSDGGCDLTDSKVVPPDGWCEQHGEKR
jgi:hypothetical protein